MASSIKETPVLLVETDGERSNTEDQGQHMEQEEAKDGDSEPLVSPSKTFIQSVSEVLVQSAQTVKAFASAQSPTAENGDEKSLFQTMGARITESAQLVKDNVSGSSDNVSTPVDETAEASFLIHSILD